MDIKELKKLKSLRKKGALTQEEFEELIQQFINEEPEDIHSNLNIHITKTCDNQVQNTVRNIGFAAYIICGTLVVLVGPINDVAIAVRFTLWALFGLVILFIRVPIIIARIRGFSNGRELTIIAILSWLSIITGITWIIALVLALIWQPKNWVENQN